MNAAVLCLDADFTLSEIISWQEAMSLLIAEKVYMVAQYAGQVIHSATEVFPLPAVVVRTMMTHRQKRVRFSRRNILSRDNYTCLYCGARPKKKDGRPDLQALTIDHVVPRAQSKDGWVTLPWNGVKTRVTSWDNVVAACYACNDRKADRTPEQAGMALLRKPSKPSRVTLAWMALRTYHIPEEWTPYLPDGGYWDSELKDD